MKAIAAGALRTGLPVKVLAEQSHVVLIGNDAAGFAVVSRDEAQPAVLGVCTEGRVGETNPALQWWLQAVDRSLASRRSAVAPASLGFPEAVGPLVSTRWGQDAPFNDWCPVGSDGTRCLTGCVATSTAQLMNYYKLPLRGQGSNVVYYPTGDTSGTPVVARFGATWFDWDHMRDT